MPWLHHIVRVAWSRRETGWRFAILGAAIFTAIQVVGHLHHEMWRDELHCWAVARNASGLWDLLTGERRYDGHPFLWYYLLHLASRVSRSYLILPVVGTGLVVLAATLWLRFAPVPRILRASLLGSYYLVYEYGVLSRSYTLGVALIFIFCALYDPYRKRLLPLAGVLALLSATSLYGTLVALALGTFLLSAGPRLETAPQGLDDRRQLRIPLAWIGAAGLLLGGVAITLLTTWPPPDSYYVPGPISAVTSGSLRNLLAQYWRGTFPFAGRADWIWTRNTALFGQSVAGAAALPWLGATWFVLCLVALRRCPPLGIAYGLGVLLMMAGQHTIYPGGWRHLGHYFILFVACVWLYAKQTRCRSPDRMLHALFAINLVVLVWTGVSALRTDYRLVFSGAMDAARFIRDHQLQDRPIVGNPDPVMPVAIVLDRPFFIPITGETADAIVYHSRRTAPSGADILEHARRLARASQGRALLVLNYDFGGGETPGVALTRIYTGGPTIVDDERFWIYDVRAR